MTGKFSDRSSFCCHGQAVVEPARATATKNSEGCIVFQFFELLIKEKVFGMDMKKKRVTEDKVWKWRTK